LGDHLEKSQIKKLFCALPEMEYWESRLHLLQCLPFMPIEKPEVKIVEKFLRKTLADHNKFVRAWAYNGFHVLAAQYPEYRGEMQQFFEMAMRDEVASVRARIRNIMKTNF